MHPLDDIDATVLETMQTQGRISWAELGEILGLSPPGAAERVRKLEARGLIRGYTALVDAFALGYTITAFIGITLERPEHRQPFLKLIERLPEVQECHHAAGDYDYLLKVRCHDVRGLELFISERLKGLKGVVQSRTTVILSTYKETTALPISLPK